jgi:hypothetical protein
MFAKDHDVSQFGLRLGLSGAIFLPRYRGNEDEARGLARFNRTSDDRRQLQVVLVSRSWKIMKHRIIKAKVVCANAT